MRAIFAALSFIISTAHAQEPSHGAGAAESGRTAESERTAETERAAVLDVIDRFFIALRQRDGAAWREIFTDGGSTGTSLYLVERKAGWSIQRNSLFDSAASLPRGERAIAEYYWNPTVLIRRTIAVVWAPYEFLSDGERTHCGVDVFTLIRADEAADWTISNITYTVEPNACAALKPDGASLRPAPPAE